MTATRRNPQPSSTKINKSVAPNMRSEHMFAVRGFLKTYGVRHMQAALLSLGQLYKAPFATLTIFIVIGIAMALPTGLFVLLDNVKSLSQLWNNPAPIVLYLKNEVQTNTAQTLVKRLESQPEIEKVEYISPQQGLASFQQQSGLGEAFNSLNDNPLPPVIIITPKEAWRSAEKMDALVNTFKAWPEVDVAQLDLQWVKRLNALVVLGERFAYVIAGLLSLGVLFIIGTTIHLATQNQREEIFILELLGASKRFIRRPFLYTGIWYGLFGSIIAWLLITMAYLWLREPVQNLTQLYGSHFEVHALGFNATVLILSIGCLLGLIGAWSIARNPKKK